MLYEMLEDAVASWERLDHPALLERFVLRNGRHFKPSPRIGRKRRAHRCFENAALFVRDRREQYMPPQYVEGFTLAKDLPVRIHHAWVTMHGDDAMDPTLDAEGREYFGVVMDWDTLDREINGNGVYGVFDPGHGLNFRYMFSVDPELESIVRKIQQRSDRWMTG
jgi:hypothetical protein